MRRLGRSLFVALMFVPCVVWAQGGIPLGPEFRVNTYTTNSQSLPAVASDSSGNFVVVWQSDQDGGFDVFGQRYASTGVRLGPEFRVNTYTTSTQRLPAVASGASGNFVVVWQSLYQDGSGYGVFGQVFAGSGAPLGPEFQLNTYTANSQSAPDVAADASGNFIVVWQSYTQDGSGYGVFGKRCCSSTGVLGPEFRVNTYTTSFQRLPAVASDASGKFVVVWQSFLQDGYGDGVFGKAFGNSGAPLGPEFQLNTYTTRYQSGPDVAADASGFVVVWQSDAQDGSGYGVFGQRCCSSTGVLGPEFRVNTYTTSTQRGPAVASDSSGNFVVVWQSYDQDGSVNGVFGQRYDSIGAPLGPEFRVNTYTTARQDAPAVASDAAGNFVVGWQSLAQEGSSYGVFGQRYSAIAPVERTRLDVE